MFTNLLYFFAGVLTTSLILYILYLVSKRKSRSKLVITQSEIYTVLRYLNIERNDVMPRTTQAMQIAESKPVRFVQTEDGRVFWMEENVLYWTKMQEGEEMNLSSGNPVKTTNLSRAEMVELLTILDALQNG